MTNILLQDKLIALIESLDEFDQHLILYLAVDNDAKLTN